MTWGARPPALGAPAAADPLRVRPHLIVPANVEGLEAGDLTEGHRVHDRAPSRSAPATFDEYREALAGHFVVLDADERQQRIQHNASGALCRAHDLDFVEDDDLLVEVGGLAEWPVPVLGSMDPAFLELPPEVIRTSMRTHQRYFAVQNRTTGKLAARFVVVANIDATDGGALVAAGNARVLSARLKDAQFFWDEDRRAGFQVWGEKLVAGVTFHAKLAGTMAERVARLGGALRRRSPRLSALIRSERGRRLIWQRPISRRPWSGNFPSCRAWMGSLLRP